METTFLGNNEFIKHGGQLFLKTEESCFAFYNIEWAKKILSSDNVKFQNGMMSHDVAHDVLEEAQDNLLCFLCATLPKMSTS